MEVIFNNDYFQNNSHFNFSQGQLFMESLKPLFFLPPQFRSFKQRTFTGINYLPLISYWLLVEYVNVYFSIMMSIMFATKSKT